MGRAVAFTAVDIVLNYRFSWPAIRRFHPIENNLTEPVRALQVSEVTYYRWRKAYGGMRVDQAKRLKEVEKENARLRKAVADLTLDKLILEEAAKGNW